MKIKQESVEEQLKELGSNYDAEAIGEYTRIIIHSLVQSDIYEAMNRLNRCNLISFVYDVNDLFLAVLKENLINEN